jgi:hypothetical protein
LAINGDVDGDEDDVSIRDVVNKGELPIEYLLYREFLIKWLTLSEDVLLLLLLLFSFCGVESMMPIDELFKTDFVPIVGVVVMLMELLCL